MNAIETEQLTKVFEKPKGWRRMTRATPVTAVNSVTLTIPQGQLFGLLGPNGAGKTTLVKMLCTLILPAGGSATVAGHDLPDASAIRAAVGLVVSDERSFYWRLSAQRNLEFFAAMHGLYGRAARQRIHEVLAQVDLVDVAERRFGNLSSGMRQRLAIARSLLHRPQILFLDEPSRSLDPRATQRLHALIRELKAGQEMTVFLITHDLVEADTLCDRVALMHRGRIQATGSPAELRRRLHREHQYTIQVESVPTAVLETLRQIPSLSYRPGEEHHDGISRIQLRAVAGDGSLTAVLDTLNQYNLTIYHVENTPPTLEEVFNHFTKDKGERMKDEGRNGTIQ